MTARAQRIQKRRNSRLRHSARTLHRRLYQDDAAIALPMLVDAMPACPPGAPAWWPGDRRH